MTHWGQVPGPKSQVLNFERKAMPHRVWEVPGPKCQKCRPQVPSPKNRHPSPKSQKSTRCRFLGIGTWDLLSLYRASRPLALCSVKATGILTWTVTLMLSVCAIQAFSRKRSCAHISREHENVGHLFNSASRTRIFQADPNSAWNFPSSLVSVCVWCVVGVCVCDVRVVCVCV